MAASNYDARTARYSAVAILLHWLIAVGVGVLILLGFVMTHLTSMLSQMEVFSLYQLHKSIGITVLLLAVLRLAWRIAYRPPPLPPHMPALEKQAAHSLHWLLYVMMLGLPLVGWGIVSAAPLNLPTVLYGVIPWPDLPLLAHLADKATVTLLLEKLHNYGGYLMAVLILVHTAAALRHHYVKRDPVLQRMVPGIGKKPSKAFPS